jgi:quercetin dioxygenase-like cupin family protein/DNA-binding XRE family transcriptional regulator
VTGEIRDIAERIKELREISCITAESLAEHLGISVGAYRQYESGECDIPVSVLYEIAGKFNVELTEILTGEGPRLHTYSLVRKGTGVDMRRSHDYEYQSLAPNFVHKRMEPMLVTVEPVGPQGDMHSHPGQEFDYVLSGKMAITIDDHELVLDEGDSLYYDSNHPHSMRALNDQPARFLAIIL